MDQGILSKNRFYKWIIVQAYKHDGHLHREWSPAYLIEETDDYWALVSRASLVTESDGRRWMTKEPAVFFLYKKKWMNIICMSKPKKGICYYVNIATPTILDGGYLRYIDYDLDMKLFPDNSMKELDEQEFERHILTYGYSSDLTKAIKKSFKEVHELMEEKAFPFKEGDVQPYFDRFVYETRPFNQDSFLSKTK
jgi:protein associated with RNAse G/E